MCMSPWSRDRLSGTVLVDIRAGLRCLDGYTGWVYGWVIPVYYPATQLPRAKVPEPRPAKRAPEAPSRGWSGWVWESGTAPFACDPGPPIPLPTLRARSVQPCWPSLVGGWTLQRARARFHAISHKVSQNAKVSPNMSEKACHSPYIPKQGPEVTSWISGISVSGSLLSQGINGSFWRLTGTLLSK